MDALAPFGGRILGRTPKLEGRARSEEISAMMEEHNLPGNRCLVLDDDGHLFPTPLPEDVRLYLTDAKAGFTAADAVTLLNEYGRRGG